MYLDVWKKPPVLQLNDFLEIILVILDKSLNVSEAQLLYLKRKITLSIVVPTQKNRVMPPSQSPSSSSSSPWCRQEQQVDKIMDTQFSDDLYPPHSHHSWEIVFLFLWWWRFLIRKSQIKSSIKLLQKSEYLH